ncbi:MAG: carboxypeptidase regulatory-like domain-containing protein [Rhodopirellula sp.]|nr:carboxypeptidase regulatory-like domain-containing protein [Rhodopirellula sp.]
MRFLTLIAVAVASLLATELRAEDATPQEFQWNVFLSDWHLLGPFPKEADDETGLATQYVPNEATLSAGQVSFYRNQLYAWKPFSDRVIDFRAGLGANGTKGENKVAYAWTQFLSPVAQKVQMGVAYDDAFIGWVNGKEVARGTDNWASSLDQEVVDVDLKAGVNTLLLRVSNGRTKWDAAVRFFPAGLKKPLFTFKASPASNNTRLPVVDVQLLDQKRQVISEYQCSGSREAYPGNPGYYALYAPMPDPVPSFVKLMVRQPYFQEVDTIASWERAGTGNVFSRLLSRKPASLLVVDKLTRKPIKGAQVWSGKDMAEPTTGADGRVILPDVSSMSDRLYVVAKGYEAATVYLKWPRGAMQRVELIEGGRTLTGTVVSTTGEPLPGATVTSGLSGYAPSAVTNEKGEFEIYGLPKDQQTLYPVIEAPGFVTKGRFGFQLTSDEMLVKWELAPGTTIVGQVVHQETGEPISGIKVIVGNDRFGSNDKTPKAKTDTNGRYRLIGVNEGQILLHAFSDNYAPAMKTVSTSIGTETKADFTLNEGKPVTGTVTDPDGKPLAGVWLVTDTWNGARMFIREDRTDENGRFTLAHMPEIVAEVDILKSGFISNRRFRMRGGDIVDLTMMPTVKHTIIVRDADGKIVPQLQITKGYLWEGNPTWNWRSDDYETTRYYDKLKGVMKIEMDEPFNGHIAYRFRATGFKEEIVNIPDNVSVGKEFKVTLKPASVFSGRVVDAASGKPLPGIAVAIVSAEDQMRPDHHVDFTTPWRYLGMNRFTGQHTMTDAAGEFRLSPPAGSSNPGIALLSKEGGFHLVNDLNAVLTSSKLSDDVLDLPFPKQGSIEGRVTVADKPLANTKVHLSWMGYDGTANRGNQSFGFGGQVTTDANGVFRYENVGPGRYQISRVVSFSLGQGSSMSTYIGTENLTLLPGQSLIHDLSTSAGARLSGVARDADGKPVSGAMIKVTASGDNSRQLAATTSATDGQFEIEHLGPGTYDVSAEHYGRAEQGYYQPDQRGTATVEMVAANRDVTIRLAPVNQQAPVQPVATPITKTLSPDFTVTPLGADKPFTLSDQAGKVVVVCFWTSWSDDATAIASVYANFKDDPDVEFVTVFAQDEQQLRAFEKQNKVDIEFPVITTVPYLPGQLMSVFGVTGQTGCFVIGREGLFAAEQTPANQLTATIDRALSQQVSSEPLAGKSSRLAITLSSDGSTRGVYGATVGLKAFGTDGKMVREDRYSVNGIARQIMWRYPQLTEDGRLEVTISGNGINTRTETVKSPSAHQKLVFDVKSPRVVSGKIVMATDDKPVADVIVRLQMHNGEILTAMSDPNGKFSVPCFPGTYYVVAVGNELFAAQASSPQTVMVAADEDPEPLEFKVVPAVTLRGLVVDQSGKAVAGATVSSQGGSTATTAADGTFKLTGVASVGSLQLWAMSGSVYGAIRLTSPDIEKAHKITLGQGLGNFEVTVSGMTVGSEVLPFDALTLDGEQTRWQPTAEGNRLLVFCALWHPASKVLLEKARTWAEENNTSIELISLDWNLDQARREAASLKLSDHTLYAGPGQLRLDPEWALANGRGAFLIGSDGKLAGNPLD